MLNFPSKRALTYHMVKNNIDEIKNIGYNNSIYCSYIEQFKNYFVFTKDFLLRRFIHLAIPLELDGKGGGNSCISFSS